MEVPTSWVFLTGRTFEEMMENVWAILEQDTIHLTPDLVFWY